MKIYPLLSCAAARDKLIKVKAYIKTESGSAVIRLRMNGKVLEYTPDTDGRFEREFNFQNGGNYIMIDFDRFTGTAGTVKKFLPFSLILYIPVHRFRECTSSDCSRR